MARSDKIGIAVLIRHGMMEYWSDGILKTRVRRNDICFYLDDTVQKIKTVHNPLLIPKIPLFSPIHRLCEP
jgi:hypothetical protein